MKEENIENKKKKKIITGVILITLLISVVLGLNSNKILDFDKNKKKSENEINNYIDDGFSCTVYDNQDENNIKLLVSFSSEDGIEYVKKDNEQINVNGKKYFEMDCMGSKNETLSFDVKKGNENEETKTIILDDETIENGSVKLENISGIDGYKSFKLTKHIEFDGYRTYYKIGKNETNFTEGNAISIMDCDAVRRNLINDNNTLTVTAKIENTTLNYSVEFSKDFEVDTTMENGTFSSSESLLKVAEQSTLKTGEYSVSIEDEQYGLSTYVIDDDMNIADNLTIGVEDDVATSSRYAQNMIVLKVNGNITIEEGATLTSYASTSGYGGPKGMLIYCTGTITNNGTISMTARGAWAEGQNVYLWKNADSSNNEYEIIPKVGASVSSVRVANYAVGGVKGNDGYDRKTGGGGSGGIWSSGDYGYATSGAGAAGTSYSGGSGGRRSRSWGWPVTRGTEAMQLEMVEPEATEMDMGLLVVVQEVLEIREEIQVQIVEEKMEQVAY